MGSFGLFLNKSSQIWPVRVTPNGEDSPSLNEKQSKRRTGLPKVPWNAVIGLMELSPALRPVPIW